MKKFKFLPPYKPNNVINGVTTFRESNKRSGVYLIKEDGVIVYVGFSHNDLYRTMYRHFQEWNSRLQYTITYASKMKRYNYTVRVVYCTPGQADRLEKMLILKYRPRDNNVKYDNYVVSKADLNVKEAYFDAPVERIAPF